MTKKRVKGVYIRNNVKYNTHYKKVVDVDWKTIYGVNYGKNAEDVIDKRRRIVGDEPDSYHAPTELNLLILGASSRKRDINEIEEGFRVFRKITFLENKKEGEKILEKIQGSFEISEKISLCFC